MIFRKKDSIEEEKRKVIQEWTGEFQWFIMQSDYWSVQNLGKFTKEEVEILADNLKNLTIYAYFMWLNGYTLDEAMEEATRKALEIERGEKDGKNE